MPPTKRKYHIRSLASIKRGKAENGPGHDGDNATLEDDNQPDHIDDNC